MEGETERSDAECPGFHDGTRPHRCRYVIAIGASSKRYVRSRHCKDDERKQSVHYVDAAVGEQRLGKGEKDRSCNDRCYHSDKHRVLDDMGMWSLRPREFSRRAEEKTHELTRQMRI